MTRVERDRLVALSERIQELRAHLEDDFDHESQEYVKAFRDFHKIRTEYAELRDKSFKDLLAESVLLDEALELLEAAKFYLPDTGQVAIGVLSRKLATRQR